MLWSSIAIVIGPVPPGIGVRKPATSPTDGVDVAADPLIRAGQTDVEAGSAGLDHVGRDDARTPDGGDDDVGSADV